MTAPVPARDDPSHPLKVRRAKVGGHRDDFDPDQLAQIDALVTARPCFGYGLPTPTQRSA